MRLRLRELLADRGMTYYSLSKASGDRISLSTAYRLKKQDGRLKFFEADLLETLAEVLNVHSMDDLLERDAPKRRRR